MNLFRIAFLGLGITALAGGYYVASQGWGAESGAVERASLRSGSGGSSLVGGRVK